MRVFMILLVVLGLIGCNDYKADRDARMQIKKAQIEALTSQLLRIQEQLDSVKNAGYKIGDEVSEPLYKIDEAVRKIYTKNNETSELMSVMASKWKEIKIHDARRGLEYIDGFQIPTLKKTLSKERQKKINAFLKICEKTKKAGHTDWFYQSILSYKEK